MLDLLPSLYQQATVPQAVVDELKEGRAQGINLPDILILPWMQVKAVREEALLGLATDLGRGERQVLALTIQTSDSLALLDDGLARQYARLIGIAFTGTLGVLLKAKQTGYLIVLSPLLDQLERLRFRLDSDTRQAVLKLAGE
ncbi:MAG TPA: DUF3368 domain-containing protein [Blastocatellia bacterium]|nr:DUF3368 domain-containing protein [Blastocatellia bacterium]